MYGLLAKCEVKMAGYWPSSFFACLWTEAESRSINSQKKNEGVIARSYFHIGLVLRARPILRYSPDYSLNRPVSYSRY